MSKFNFKLVASILVFGLSSCEAVSDTSNPQNNATVMSLAGSEWDAGIKGQYVNFSSESKLNGNGGCNRFFANYTQEGTTLNIGPIGATKMMCADMKAEDTFFKTLRATQTIDASHLVLIFKDTDGKTLLTLKRRDWD